MYSQGKGEICTFWVVGEDTEHRKQRISNKNYLLRPSDAVSQMNKYSRSSYRSNVRGLRKNCSDSDINRPRSAPQELEYEDKLINKNSWKRRKLLFNLEQENQQVNGDVEGPKESHPLILNSCGEESMESLPMTETDCL